MPAEFACPHCGTRCDTESSRHGGDVACPRCGQVFPRHAAKPATPSPALLEPPPPAVSDEPVPPPLPNELQDDDGARLPERIGRFRIRRRLGSGAFGTVYLADDPVLERQVALKVMRRDAPGGSAAQTRFVREAKAAARLNHPQIVPVFDAGQDGKHFFIAAEYVQGETLEREIERGLPEPTRAAWICQRLAAALHYAHQSGIVHRDVKSGNVMVDSTGDVHLMDFGLARVHGSDERLTREGTLLGTAAYMAPEQASRELGAVGPRSDQYSLAVVLYELLCGQVPFSGPLAVVLYNVTSTEPVSPRSVVATGPRDLETICLKAIAKRPEGRYADCGQLAEDLRRWLAGEAITARRETSVERLTRWSQRNPLVASLAGLVALLLLLAAIIPWVGYGLVAQRVAERIRAQGSAEELRGEIATAEHSLGSLRDESKALLDERPKLEDTSKGLEQTAQELDGKLKRIARMEPVEFLKNELRQIAGSAAVPAEPTLSSVLPSPRVAARPLAAPPVGRPPRPQSPGVPKPLPIGQADPIAALVPADCVYARFARPLTLQRLLEAYDALAATAKGVDARGPLRSRLARLQGQLYLPDVPSGFELADALVAGLAVIGTELPGPNGDVGIILQAANGVGGRLLGEIIRWQRNAALRHDETALELTVTIQGQRVSLITSNDGSDRVRSYYAAAGNFHLITNSQRLVSHFLTAGRGRRSLASTERFRVAEQMLQQAPVPEALFLDPRPFLNPADFLPLVAAVSLTDPAPNRQRSLSFEVAVPSACVEHWLGQIDSLFGRNLSLVALYRELAKCAPRTRLAPVPGETLCGELAITETCRVFGGANGAGWYVGISEPARYFEFFQEVSKQTGLEWLAAQVKAAKASWDNDLGNRDGLDPQGYGKCTPGFLGISSRRVFNDGWIAVSPEKATLEKVTPLLKVESAARPATVRFRTGDPLAAARTWPLALVPGLDLEFLRDVELNLAADRQHLFAFGKIGWSGPPETPAKATVKRHPDWQKLRTLLSMQSYPPLTARVEKDLLITIERLRAQVLNRKGNGASEADALARLFELERGLLSLRTAAREAPLQRIQADTDRLLVQVIQRQNLAFFGMRWFAVLKALGGKPAPKRPLWNGPVDKPEEFPEWIEQLQALLTSVQDVANAENPVEKGDAAELESVRKVGETRRGLLIKALADGVIQNRQLKTNPTATYFLLGDLFPLLPNAEEAKAVRQRIREHRLGRAREQKSGSRDRKN
jgi:serine/threonine protein kinase